MSNWRSWLSADRVPEISPSELQSWLQEGKPLQLVDARTRLEYQMGSLPGARHAPLLEMPASLERLNLDAGRPVVVLCLSGHRSIPGTRWLRERGLQAYSLKGGLTAWKLMGYPLTKTGT